MAEVDEILRMQGIKWGGWTVCSSVSLRCTKPLLVVWNARWTYIEPIRIQCAHARPDFWGVLRSAVNFFVRADAMLCRLDKTQICNSCAATIEYHPKRITGFFLHNLSTISNCILLVFWSTKLQKKYYKNWKIIQNHGHRLIQYLKALIIKIQR